MAKKQTKVKEVQGASKTKIKEVKVAPLKEKPLTKDGGILATIDGYEDYYSPNVLNISVRRKHDVKVPKGSPYIMPVEADSNCVDCG